MSQIHERLPLQLAHEVQRDSEGFIAEIARIARRPDISVTIPSSLDARRIKSALPNLRVLDQNIDSMNRWHGITLGE